MTRPSGYCSHRGELDGGFTLIEVIVALFLLSMVATAVLALFFRGMQATSHLERSQAADSVAMSAMEKVRSISAQAAPGVARGVLLGRTQAAVAAVWGPADPADIADSNPVWDPAATASSIPVVPLVADTVRAGIHYTVTTLIGECFRVASHGDEQPCTKTGAGASILRATVVVLWKPTSSGQCGAAGLCTYRLSSLLDPNPESNWSLTSSPVAYDDVISPVTGTSSQNYDILTNDAIGPVTSNPVTKLTDPVFGTAAVITSGASMGMLTYTPPVGISGKTSLTYMLRDAAGRVSDPATVAINVMPQADDSSATAHLGESVTIDLTSKIHGTFGASPITLVGTPPAVVAGDIVTFTAPTTGSSVSFTYTVTDTSLLVSTQATVTIGLIPATPPRALDLAYSMVASIPPVATNLPILASTSNYSGDTILVASGPTPAAGWGSPGALAGTGTSALLYTPIVNTVGVYTFTYHVQHPTGAISVTKTVTLTVTPVATNDVLSVAKGASGTVDVSLNDVPTTGMTYARGAPGASDCGTDATLAVGGVVTFTATGKNKNATCTVPYVASKTVGTTTLSASATLTITAAK